jgi:hypothetical protein
MRTKEFEIPTDLIAEFAEVLSNNELNNSITGVNEQGEILITVEYDKEDRATVFELSELVDDYKDQNE